MRYVVVSKGMDAATQSPEGAGSLYSLWIGVIALIALFGFFGRRNKGVTPAAGKPEEL